MDRIRWLLVVLLISEGLRCCTMGAAGLLPATYLFWLAAMVCRRRKI